MEPSVLVVCEFINEFHPARRDAVRKRQYLAPAVGSDGACLLDFISILRRRGSIGDQFQRAAHVRFVM
eukprot:9729314-Heterocapsa_arctica.AAC.1